MMTVAGSLKKTLWCCPSHFFFLRSFGSFSKTKVCCCLRTKKRRCKPPEEVMKIYVTKGVEGEAGYVKQSMKLPKSWESKPLQDVLCLFVETYNKKFGGDESLKIDAERWHFERPLGSTLFPDDQVNTVLADYCDVWCVAGSVRYKGPPPGTAAALELKEAEERKIQEEAAAKKAVEVVNDASKAQWNVKVKCVSLDRGGMDVKSQWKENDTARVVIEPYATVGMLKNRIGLMVGAHPKHQTIRHPKRDEPLGDLEKLKDVMSSDHVLLLLDIKVPIVTRIVDEVSDDEGILGEEEDPLPEDDLDMDICSDAGAQAELKAAAQDAEMNSENQKALDLYSEAVKLGGPSPLLLCKRGDLLLKLKRPKAAERDASKALSLNPDSAKAYKLRAKARRKLGHYELASADFGQAQRIDFDDSIVQEQSYVTKRATKIRAKQLFDEEQARQQHIDHEASKQEE